MVKHQIEGSNDDEILRIRYPWKAYETRNPMKQKSNDLDLRSGEKSVFQNQQKSTLKFGQNEKQFDF